ncbi:MAG: ABC transporter permease [Longimicrobiales bacterium]|nr:ABC transporter permease [Longimicrobiales bacterium]
MPEDGKRHRIRRLLRLPLGDERRVREEVDDELRFHIEQRAARYEREGMPPDEARVQAERRFGDFEEIREEVERMTRRRRRSMERTDLVDDLRRDAAFAFRQISGHPAFSAVVVATIALAIGATTAVFSVVDGILLRPLPYDEPDELVMVWMDYTERDVVLPDKRREWLSWPNFADFRDEVEAVEAVSAFGGWRPTLTGDGVTAQQLDGARFSHGMFSDVLAVEPAVGRGFLPEEDAPDGPRVVLLSDGLWQRAFGGDPDILGSSVLLNDVPFTVVGVMPPDFRPPPFLGSDLWTPLQLDRTNGGGRGSIFLRAVGRLADGASLEVARAQATDLALRLEEEYPVDNVDTGFNVYPLHFDLVNQERTALWLLMGAVGFVLLIATVNVANLLLARGANRGGELAVRVAMGAGRRRILSQLLTESTVLAAVGGAFGIALAFVGTDLLVRLAPPGTPLLEQVSVDLRILGFAALVTILTGALFGLLPAFRASRADPAQALREGGRSGSASASARLRGALVVGQVGLALVLLVGAGLLVRSFQNLQDVELGFSPEGVLSARIQLPPVRYPDAESRLAFFGPLEERLEALPGVQAVGSIDALPLAGFDGDVTFAVEGAAPARPGLEPTVWLRRITPGYLDAMGLELVAGRAFTPSDDGESTRVILVNETLQDAYFDGQAVGKRLNVNDPADPVWREVVGVVRDIKNFGIRAESRNAMYLPYAQAPSPFMFTAIRASGDLDAVVGPVRAAVAELDPGVALAMVQPMEERVSSSLSTDRFTTSLLGGFALVAMLLALVGLYGVVSYTVSMRMREMGVRIALGAPRGQIRTLVLRWSFRLVLAGIVLGAIGAVGVSRILESLLFGVGGTDPLTFASVGGLMIVAALLASLIPALRATRVDPIEVLKSE